MAVAAIAAAALAHAQAGAPPARANAAPRAQPAVANPTANAAPADTARSDTLHVSAGRARYVRENGEWVSYLESGVRLESEGTTIDSRRARTYRTRQLAYFYDDVVVHDGTVVMKGDTGEFSRLENIAALRGRVTIDDEHGRIRAQRVRYWRRDRIAWLWGKVDFQDAKSRVQADSVLYRQAEGKGEAFGSVVITDLETGSVVRGSHAFYDRNTGQTRIDAAPRMVLRQKVGGVDTAVEADDARFDQQQRAMRTRGHVRITRGGSTATADSAVLYEKDDRVLLRGRPRMNQGDTTMRGTEIDIFYKDNDVERVAVRGAAQVLQSRSDTLIVREPNEVRGDSAQLYFTGGNLSRAVVVGNATSKFVPAESQSDRVSRNEARGDSILMRFENDAVQEVLFKGNASGTYRYFEGNLDSLRAPAAAHFDSTFGVVRGDTTRIDFDARAQTVQYSAESILYMAQQNDLLLQKAAEVQYEGNTLRAGRIRYDADTDILDATERPALDDAGDRIYGDRMGYDMGTRDAWIDHGSTQYDQGFYTGKLLRKKEDGVLQVRDASYTTCDLAHPHYRFDCGRMKIYLRKKIVGRPVVVHLGEVPVGYLPFIVNYTDTGRHSGFLQPDVGFGVTGDSRFVRGLQYFWAASPYFDFLFSGDYLDRARPNRSSVQAVLQTSEARSARFAINTRYKLRYRVDGNLNYNFRKTFDPRGNAFSYTLGGNHQQTLGERTTLRGSLDYASSSTAIRDVNEFTNFERSLQRNLSSGLTLNRRGDWVTTSATINRVQILNPEPDFTGRLITRRLPDLRVAFPLVSLAPSPRDSRREPVQAFFHSLQFQPALNYSRETSDDRVAVIDTTGGVRDTTFVTRANESVRASTGVSLGRSGRLLMFSLNPSVSYSENYQKDTRNPGLQKHQSRVTTGVTSATTLYGLFYPRVFGIEAIRHRVDPRASLAFQPRLRGQQPETMSLGLSLANTFDLKVRGGKTGERKIDAVLDWRLSTNYNPRALRPLSGPTRNFANIASTIQINRGGPLQLSVSQTYDPYRKKVISTTVPFSLRMGGRFGYGDVHGPEDQRNRVIEEEGGARADSLPTGESADDSTEASAPRQARSAVDEALQDVRPAAVGGEGTLNWGLSLSYSLSRVEGRTQRASVPVSVSVQPTRNWEVQFGTYYDATTRELGQPTMRITRQLHCWKASFSRVRFGGEWQYYFRLFVERHSNELFLESGDRSLGY